MASETSPTWVIDPDGPAELVRRMQWGHLMNRVVGLFPHRVDLTEVYRILEIGCGGGEWTLEAVRYFPVSYVGLDGSRSQVAYAQAMAKVVGYDDLVRFEQADLSQPLPFADGSFDLVHARFLAHSLPTTQWPRLLHGAWRVLTPGGCILLSEADWPSTTSPAMQQFADLVTQALGKAGYGRGLDGHPLTSAEGLPALLQQQHWGLRDHVAHVLPFSVGLPLHGEMLKQLWLTAQLMQPFLRCMGCASQQQLNTLCEQMMREGHAEAFVGTLSVLQAWGSKPHAGRGEKQLVSQQRSC